MGISLSELFAEEDTLSEVNSSDKTLMEKVKLMESLDEDERSTLYNILDAFVSKKKLKEALTNALDLA